MKELTAKYDVKITLLDFDKESKKLMKNFPPEIKSVYSYGDKKLIVVSEEMFESIWIYDPLTNKQTRVKNVWNFIDYTSSVVSYKKSEFDLKPRLAVITENE